MAAPDPDPDPDRPERTPTVQPVWADRSGRTSFAPLPDCVPVDVVLPFPWFLRGSRVFGVVAVNTWGRELTAARVLFLAREGSDGFSIREGNDG